MPWTAQNFRSRHNKSLSDLQAAHAARMANAILQRTGDEGLAIATANAKVGHLQAVQKKKMRK